MSKVWINKSSEANELHQSFIEIQNQGPLCGTEVDIEVSKQKGLEMETYHVDEQAYCPSCKVKTRKKQHSIH